MKLSRKSSSAISERAVCIQGLSEVDSAKLLVSMAKISLNQDELKKSTCYVFCVLRWFEAFC